MVLRGNIRLIEEDEIIADMVEKEGTKNWSKVAQNLNLHGFKKKTGKQCRERWHNHLDPNIVKKSWTAAEEQIMFQQHKKVGNKWTLIALKLPGRTDNSIKNYFYSTIRKSLRRLNKMLGSKNSTQKMKKIKPSTLSKIFAVAEGKQDEQNYINEKSISFETLRSNCREILNILMEFASWKFTPKNQALDEMQRMKFSKVMEEMTKIKQIIFNLSELYEHEKAEQAKRKRQKKLQKNFDGMIIDEEQSEEQQKEQYDRESFSEELHISRLPPEQILMTRSNRKVKPPTYYTPQVTKIPKISPVEESQQVRRSHQELIPTSFNFSMNIISQKELIENQKIKENRNILYSSQKLDIEDEEEELNSNSDFHENGIHLDIEQDNSDEMKNFTTSPNFRNTPRAVSPYQPLFFRQIFSFPFKNEDYDNHILQMKLKIAQNSQSTNRKNILSSFRSPQSAFREFI